MHWRYLILFIIFISFVEGTTRNQDDAAKEKSHADADKTDESSPAATPVQVHLLTSFSVN